MNHWVKTVFEIWLIVWDFTVSSINRSNQPQPRVTRQRANNWRIYTFVLIIWFNCGIQSRKPTPAAHLIKLFRTSCFDLGLARLLRESVKILYGIHYQLHTIVYDGNVPKHLQYRHRWITFSLDIRTQAHALTPAWHWAKSLSPCKQLCLLTTNEHQQRIRGCSEL